MSFLFKSPSSSEGLVLPCAPCFFDVSWKNIILGFYDELNDKTILLNNIISFIAYRIYKYKMFCRLDNNRESIGDIRKHIKHSLLNQYYVLMKTSCSQNISLFEKISNALWLYILKYTYFSYCFIIYECILYIPFM